MNVFIQFFTSMVKITEVKIINKLKHYIDYIALFAIRKKNIEPKSYLIQLADLISPKKRKVIT